MNDKKYKFIDLTKPHGPIIWSEPREATPEEEAEIIKQYKAQLDYAEMEAEYVNIMAQHERGELMDAEELLREIEAGTPPGKPT